MSISLLVSGENIPEADWKNIPVATEDEFENYWLPISEELDLEYIPLFQFGIEIDSDTSNDVLNELQLLKTTIKNQLTDSEYEKVISRINILTDSIPNFVKKYNTIFIG